MKKRISWISLHHKMDNLSPEQRKKNMQNIRSTGSKVERKLMKELRKRKIYFAKNVNSLCGKPDIVFSRKRLAVFVDSDFWHGHPKYFKTPKTNTDYWIKKISSNKQRDRHVNSVLRQSGWRVLRFWEHEIHKDVQRCAEKITSELSNQS